MKSIILESVEKEIVNQRQYYGFLDFRAIGSAL